MAPLPSYGHKVPMLSGLDAAGFAERLMPFGMSIEVGRSATPQLPASYMVSRVVVYGERRAREMEEVAETLRSIGIEPIMADAAARRMDWSAKQGLKGSSGRRSGELHRIREKGAIESYG